MSRSSPFAAVVSWTPRAGEEEAVQRALEQLAGATRGEAGCLGYTVHRSVEDPCRYLIYERYVDEDAFRQHLASEHFRVLGLEDAIPRLADRTRDLYRLISD